MARILLPKDSEKVLQILGSEDLECRAYQFVHQGIYGVYVVSFTEDQVIFFEDLYYGDSSYLLTGNGRKYNDHSGDEERMLSLLHILREKTNLLKSTEDSKIYFTSNNVEFTL